MPDGKPQVDALKPIPLAPLPDCPLVSILMSNFNYGCYLAEAIESCLKQSYQRFELIICDDGSTDESVNILRRYESRDPRIKAIYQAHGGQAVALNSAFSSSTGEIICLLDADDIFSCEKLRLVVSAFRAAPGSGLAANRMLRVNGARKHLGQIPALYQFPSGWHGPSLFRSGPRMLAGLPPTSGLSLRRSVAEVIFPLPACLKTCADTIIHYLGPLITPVIAIRDPVGEYRIHDRNAQARGKFTEDHVGRLVVSEKEIWDAWRDYVWSASPNSPVRSEKPPSLFSYAYARFRANPQFRAVYQAIPSDFFETLPLPYRWYWRVSVLLPNWLFRKSFNMFYAQNRTKMFAGRLLRAC